MHFYIKDAFFWHFTSRLMKKGKRFKAENLFLRALHLVQKRSKTPLPHIIFRMLMHVCPLLEVKSIRRGGGVFRVPFPLSRKKQLSLGLSGLIKEARKRKSPSLSLALSRECLEAAQGRGATARKQKSNHKLARASRAFSHFRWR